MENQKNVIDMTDEEVLLYVLDYACRGSWERKDLLATLEKGIDLRIYASWIEAK